MDTALREEMPAGYDWTHPEGGMFLWVTGPTGLDGLALLGRAIKSGVAFVPGRDFFPTEGGKNYFRLNFSNSSPERIREGVRRLAALCREVEQESCASDTAAQRVEP
jgi:2-aminoadipate transaminase